MIRRATLKDVKSIHRLIAEQAQSGHILARAMSELYSQVKDFMVSGDEVSEEIVGCGALQIVWEDLAEIRSLAVQTEYPGAGNRHRTHWSTFGRVHTHGGEQGFRSYLQAGTISEAWFRSHG